MSKLNAALMLGLAATTTCAKAQDRFGFGRSADQTDIAAWNIDVDPSGTNLPPGHGTAVQGREIFAMQCAGCHGQNGEGGVGDRLVGGEGTLATAKPVRTVGSYWPYSTTLFDYIRRAMPMNAPQSLSNDEVYAVSAYILHMNGLVGENGILDKHSLPAIKMPNRNGFVEDPRPDVK